MAGSATLFPGAQGQSGDARIEYPRADPGEPAKVNVSVTNTTDKPMKVDSVNVSAANNKPMKVGTAKLVGPSQRASPISASNAPAVVEDTCGGTTLQPHQTCSFALLIPPGTAEGGLQVEVKTDQGDVTASVAPRKPRPATSAEHTGTPGTGMPTPAPHQTSTPAGPTTGPGTTPTRQETTPSDVPPTTPSDVPPTTPSDVPPTTPSDVPPTTPSDVPPTTPSDVPPSTPSDVPSASPT
ncbi:hypothetical protein [Streptomyces sp. NPDC056682]|uniref:hypothetical protein n=1 Tax=Streptomyces sp. NPDC056682 TaxID=3345909 RepID=UPI00369FFC96